MPMRPGQRSDAAARVLFIDGDASAARALIAELSGGGMVHAAFETVRSGRQALEKLRAAAFDIVLIDLSSLADMAQSTEEAVARLAKLAEGALLVALSDGGSVSAAVAAMRAGAHDFIAKPVSGAAFATRIAASDPAMWTDILVDNREAILGSLAAFRRAVDDLEQLIAAGDRGGIEALLARMKATRESLA